MMQQVFFVLMIYQVLFQIMDHQRPDISGKWRGTDGKRVINLVMVLQNNGEYEGTTVSVSDSQKQNVILKQLTYHPDEKRFIGKMFPPDADIELKATIRIIDDGRIQLDAEKFLFRKRMILYRTK